MNLFLALLLDPALHESVAGRVRASVQAHRFTGRILAADRLHVSLLNLSDRDSSAVKRIAATVRFPPFEVRFDGAMSFRNPKTQMHPFVLIGDHGLDGVRNFHRVLDDWFFGDDPWHRPLLFNPHVTLLYDRKLVPKHTLAQPLSWMARDFVFIRSHAGRYDILGRWPLMSEVTEGIAT